MTGARDRSKSTATPANALTAEELNAFLAGVHVARLATEREDGFIHLTPVWYVYEDNRVLFTLAASRRHLKNLRRRARATVLVDEDRRPTEGFAAGARAAMLAGDVDLTDDEAVVKVASARIDTRYLRDEATDESYLSSLYPETTYLATLTPDIVLTWDFAKVRSKI